MADETTAQQLMDGWAGYGKCPEYDEDDEHQISVTQQITVNNGQPVISLSAQCTCGWSEMRTI